MGRPARACVEAFAECASEHAPHKDAAVRTLLEALAKESVADATGEAMLHRRERARELPCLTSPLFPLSL